MVDGFAKTPRYVLNEGSHPICPTVLRTPSEVQALVIYGFSDKPKYDGFLSGSSLALKPYPLVKGYLQHLIELDSGTLRLVVLDAASPAERCLCAATFQAVLESLQRSSDCVVISHRLMLDEFSSEWRIEEVSLTSPTKPVS